MTAKTTKPTSFAHQALKAYEHRRKLELKAEKELKAQKRKDFQDAHELAFEYLPEFIDGTFLRDADATWRLVDWSLTDPRSTRDRMSLTAPGSMVTQWMVVVPLDIDVHLLISRTSPVFPAHAGAPTWTYNVDVVKIGDAYRDDELLTWGSSSRWSKFPGYRNLKSMSDVGKYLYDLSHPGEADE